MKIITLQIAITLLLISTNCLSQKKKSTIAVQALFEQEAIIDLFRKQASEYKNISSARDLGARPHMTMASFMLSAYENNELSKTFALQNDEYPSFSFDVKIEIETRDSLKWSYYLVPTDTYQDLINIHDSLYINLDNGYEKKRKVDMPGRWWPHISLFTVKGSSPTIPIEIEDKLNEIKNVTLKGFSLVSFGPINYFKEITTLTNKEKILINKIDSLNKAGYNIIDYHAHLKGGLTIEELVHHSEVSGIKYGVAVNCGIGFPIQNTSDLVRHYNIMKEYPVMNAMQAEGREWLKNFNPDSVKLFEYVFTDALTFHDAKGRRTRLWMKDEVYVDNPNDFMNYYVNEIVEIISNEPIDIFVNPTFLPEVIQDKYDELWNEERILKVVKALQKNDIALEINARKEIPSAKFIKIAKQNNVKFTLGTNNTNANLGYLEYCLKIIEECNLSPSDFWTLEDKIIR